MMLAELILKDSGVTLLAVQNNQILLELEAISISQMTLFMEILLPYGLISI
jgi:hypothetical protein